MAHVTRNKQRGYELEAELVRIAKTAGIEAKRAWGSDGRAMGEKADVDCVVGPLRVQVKRRKALPAYLQLPESCDVVFFRQDRGKRLFLIGEELFFKLAKEVK